jgi:ADP-ribosyl-[dinitrogen reductase] hydrolase
VSTREASADRFATGDVLRDRCRGCLLGTAVGDALGAPGEFLSMAAIRTRFGPAGITRLHPWDDFPRGSVTDDTQMVLATAEGLVQAEQAARTGAPYDPLASVLGRYISWHDSQADPRQRRHPGHTCMTALRAAKAGHAGPAANWSKGCGGVMRSAPVGLAPPRRPAFSLGADLAALTHGHPSGYLSAGFVADLVRRLVDGATLPDAVQGSVAELRLRDASEETLSAVQQALELAAWPEGDAAAALRRLGQGWVGEEALAISLYCALRHPSDWRAAAVLAVNHDGDTDSTGAITGAILGALLGVGAIPAVWAAAVEDGAAIVALADELWQLGAEAPAGPQGPAGASGIGR